MQITNAQLTATGSITALVDGVQMSIPADAGNRHYAAMLEQGITPAPHPVPTAAETLAAERAAMVCTPAQMRLALLGAGLLTTVQAIADSDPAAAIIWEYATQIVRTSPFIDALGGPNGFTPEQIDELFRVAMAVAV